MTPKPSTRNRKILYRRSKIAGLWAEGMTQQQDIADALKARFNIDINRSSVSRDLDALKAEWKEERVAETSEAITAALRRREHLLTLALLDYEKSKEPTKTTTTEAAYRRAGTDDEPRLERERTKSVERIEERNGDPRYLTVASQQATAIEKIIGVYAPEKREIKLDQPLLILDRPTDGDDSAD